MRRAAMPRYSKGKPMKEATLVLPTRTAAYLSTGLKA
jgi:hypothetical protein